MKTMFLLGVCGMALAGTFLDNPPSNPVPSPIPSHTDHDSPSMWTYSDTLYKGDALDLHFRTPHAAYLGVVTPSGQFFYVIYPKASAVGDLKPLMDGNAFTGCGRIRLRTNALTADPYVYGVYENVPVFTETGSYRILMGDNLHVDDPNMLQSLDVFYIHKLKPKGKDSA